MLAIAHTLSSNVKKRQDCHENSVLFGLAKSLQIAALCAKTVILWDGSPLQ
jgi:hypothetical protein